MQVEHWASVDAVALQAMNEVAQRMQLRHPNIATVMGVATEPVTEDPLLVNVCTALCIAYYICMAKGCCTWPVHNQGLLQLACR